MQNYNAKCKIRMQNAKFVVSRLGTCVKMQNQYKTKQNAELEQNKTKNRIQNQNRTEFSTEKIRTEQQYEQNSKSDQNRIENIPEFRITTEQNKKTANNK